MIQNKKISWVRLLLILARPSNTVDRVTIDGAVTLIPNGDVVIQDRYFEGKHFFGLLGGDAIDFAFSGGHAYRAKKSNRLVIRSKGPSRQDLVFEYERSFFEAAWYQLVLRVT